MMLTDGKAALKVLESFGVDSNNILVKMVLQGYEPNIEPYLSLMFKARYEWDVQVILTTLKSYYMSHNNKWDVQVI